MAVLNRRIVACERCPRLRDYCRKVAVEKRSAYRNWTYHGKPVPNFGDAKARMLIVGLAPGAHGANRTGRMFTGDRSGDFLYRALFEVGLANQPTSMQADDGLKLHDALVTAALHCAPPDNKPLPDELANCTVWLDATFDILHKLRVVVCLGRIAFDAVMRLYQRRGWIERRSAYAFGHGVVHRIADRPTVVCSYHPSQQNTFTGKLTPGMMRAVMEQARVLSRKRLGDAHRHDAARLNE
ncbi:MAG: uracil-DNA glycosylase [Phycisphaeraceae bacterium]